MHLASLARGQPEPWEAPWTCRRSRDRDLAASLPQRPAAYPPRHLREVGWVGRRASKMGIHIGF